MIAYFRDLLQALLAIGEGVRAVGEALHGLHTDGNHADALAERVADLERAFEIRHAEAEGLLLQAKGKFDAARAAEERTRRLSKSAPSDEEEPDPFEDGLQELEAVEAAQLHLGDEGGSELNGLHPMHTRVDSRRASRESAYAMKWGRR